MAVLLSSCAFLRPPAEEEEEEILPDEAAQPVAEDEQRVFLGNITQVNQASRFVLIKTPVNQRLQAGIPLQSFNETGLSAELLFSPEQTFGFMTADIREGAPLVGDAVYLRYTQEFENTMSPRMQAALERFEYEQSLGFFERIKYNREQKRLAKEKAKAREARLQQ